MIIILTGVPGTGKDTVAEILEKRGFIWLSLNRIIKERKLWKSKEGGCLVADIRRLEKEVKREAKESSKNGKKILVEGHLACELNIPSDACIVLRTNPSVLRKRLEKRGYLKKKIDDNILCEELDYCTQKAEANLGCPVYEVRTDKSIGSTMRDVSGIISKGRDSEKFRAGRVDWSACLLGPEKRVPKRKRI